MKFKARPKVHNHINIAPLVDVVFLLLIFFMLTFHVQDDQNIPLNLPGARSAEQQSPEALVVSLDPHGNAMVGEQVVPAEQLSTDTVVSALRASTADTTTPIRIRADENAPTGKLVALMDGARIAGFSRVEIQVAPLP